MQKEAQQETQIAVNSFKWFNVYLVPEIRHQLKMQPSAIRKAETMDLEREKVNITLHPNSIQDGGSTAQKMTYDLDNHYISIC